MKKIIQNKENNTRFNRINFLYEKLSNTANGFTITELADELDVSTKTIQRDLYEVLSEYGVVKNGRYWKINPKLSEDNLANNERIVLGILDEMAKNAGKTFYSKAHSLISQVSQQLEHPIFTSISSEKLTNADMVLFEELENVIKLKSEISIKYEKFNFILKPLKLAFFDGYWYLLAMHVKKSKEIFKKFHLKTIRNMQVLNNSFEIPQIVEERLKHANSVWFNLDEQFVVRLYIDKNIRKYFERKPLRGQTIIGEDNDGSIEIEIFLTDKMEILPLIYWYIPHIKVLEPQWLADSLKEQVQSYFEQL